jgi:hypothetical protein
MHRVLDSIAEVASANHGVVATAHLRRLGLPLRTQATWLADGRLVRLGTRSFTLPGTAPTWEREVAAAMADLDGRGYLAGRTSAVLHGLDGFVRGRSKRSPSDPIAASVPESGWRPPTNRSTAARRSSSTGSVASPPNA